MAFAELILKSYLKMENMVSNIAAMGLIGLSACLLLKALLQTLLCTIIANRDKDCYDTYR